MTTAAGKRRSSFGRILRSELDEQHVSIRELARRIADNSEKIESNRRLLHQYLSGEVSPRAEMRDRIADALEIDAKVFTREAEREVARARLLDALEPLADILLDIATRSHE